MKFLITSIVLSAALLSTVFSYDLDELDIACRDEQGIKRDWFSAYKFPKISDNENDLVKGGAGYVYLHEDDQKFQMGKVGFNESDSIVGKTLESFYETDFGNKNTDRGFLLYNDQYKDQQLSSRAHAKGVIYFDDKSAVWIVHSFPHYPSLPSTGKYTLGGSQMRYGQTMICLTLPLEELEKVGNQLMWAWPQHIDSSFPESSNGAFYLKFLQRVAKKGKHRKPKKDAESEALSWANQEDLRTIEGNKMSTFYKGQKFGEDVWADLISPGLGADMMTETWSNGVGGVLGSDCDAKYKVNNIKYLNFSKFNVKFKVNKDHGKWGLGIPQNPRSYSKRAICIGDMNRMQSQFKRGGGAICIKSESKAWKEYLSIIDETEPCPIAA